jgi:hypothetical protein
VRELLLVGQIAVARVEGLREEQKTADTVSILCEIGWVGELVRVLVGVICPNMFNFISRGRNGDIVRKSRRVPRFRLDVIGNRS